jgi:hypothetical protein
MVAHQILLFFFTFLLIDQMDVFPSVLIQIHRSGDHLFEAYLVIVSYLIFSETATEWICYFWVNIKLICATYLLTHELDVVIILLSRAFISYVRCTHSSHILRHFPEQVSLIFIRSLLH